MGLRSSQRCGRSESKLFGASSRTASGRKGSGAFQAEIDARQHSGSRSTSGGSSRSGTRSPPRSSPPVIMGRRSRPSRRRRRRRTTRMIEGRPTKNKPLLTTSRNYGYRSNGTKSGGPRKNNRSSSRRSTSRRWGRTRLYCGERGRAVQHPPPIKWEWTCRAGGRKSSAAGTAFIGVLTRGRRGGCRPAPRGSCAGR